jgi:hypothetical protein
MSQIDKDILFEQIKDTSVRTVNLNDVLDRLYDSIREIQRRDKPTKNAKAYAEEEETKLLYIQDILKKSIWEAYSNDADIFQKTLNWKQVNDNFEFHVIVRKR